MASLSDLTPDMGCEIHGRPGELLPLDGMREMLDTRGALLFRNFNASVSEFEQFTKAFTPNFLVHHGLGRGFISEDGTTQTVAPGSAYIPAHIERGYASPIPGFVFFYCVDPGEVGGETTIYDGCAVFEALDPDLQAFFLSNKLLWKVKVGPEIWSRTLQTEEPAVAATRLQAQIGAHLNPEIGEATEIRFDGDMLEMHFLTPSIRPAARGSRQAFANSALSYLDSWQNDPSIFLGLEDGSPFPVDQLQRALERSEQSVVAIRWQKGDLIAIDNFTVLHGRRAVTDPTRTVYIRIGF